MLLGYRRVLAEVLQPPLLIPFLPLLSSPPRSQNSTLLGLLYKKSHFEETCAADNFEPSNVTTQVTMCKEKGCNLLRPGKRCDASGNTFCMQNGAPTLHEAKYLP